MEEEEGKRREGEGGEGISGRVNSTYSEYTGFCLRWVVGGWSATVRPDPHLVPTEHNLRDHDQHVQEHVYVHVVSM